MRDNVCTLFVLRASVDAIHRPSLTSVLADALPTAFAAISDRRYRGSGSIAATRSLGLAVEQPPPRTARVVRSAVFRGPSDSC